MSLHGTDVVTHLLFPFLCYAQFPTSAAKKGRLVACAAGVAPTVDVVERRPPPSASQGPLTWRQLCDGLPSPAHDAAILAYLAESKDLVQQVWRFCVHVDVCGTCYTNTNGLSDVMSKSKDLVQQVWALLCGAHHVGWVPVGTAVHTFVVHTFVVHIFVIHTFVVHTCDHHTNHKPLYTHLPM